jgi:hypothetical protein
MFVKTPESFPERAVVRVKIVFDYGLPTQQIIDAKGIVVRVHDEIDPEDRGMAVRIDETDANRLRDCMIEVINQG